MDLNTNKPLFIHRNKILKNMCENVLLPKHLNLNFFNSLISILHIFTIDIIDTIYVRCIRKKKGLFFSS